RMEEVFTLLHEEIGRTGYAELLPAGVVLTGGSSLLKGLPELASRVLHMPVRVGQPDKLTGMVDKLQSPAYATSVGLLKWAVLMNEVSPNSASSNGTHGDKSIDWKEWVKRFLP
ncbi:MAG: cell division protein FtsA, partial [Anaerolineales bacterium]|nr:cell division protein FtsA [Anaerolineales bacterium]